MNARTLWTSVIAVLAIALMTSQTPSCQSIANEIASLKKDRTDFQNDLKKASPGQKSAIASEIKKINAQIAAKEKQLQKCQCPEAPDSYYKLPFADDPNWQLCKGNWDDPINGHDKGNANGGQAYAFDFVYTPTHDCRKGTEGHKILAVRAGQVIAMANDRQCNVWNLKEGDPCYGKPGEGNYVLIRHSDNTVAAYDHLQKGTISVAKNGQVARGQMIGLSGNTGNSSTPHVHLDVRKYWNSPSDLGPTLPIKFQDKHHVCWRPKVGDDLASNNQ
ncbi:MAG TPA: M23 family metallopeptidase [Thermoanaerobaculia bacterium]